MKEHRNIPGNVAVERIERLVKRVFFWFFSKLTKNLSLRIKLVFIMPFVSIFLASCSHGIKHTKAPDFDLYEQEKISITTPGNTVTHDVYVFKGKSEKAPPVILLHELPGLSANTLYFAKILSDNFTVYVPLLFGEPNQDSTFLGLLAYIFNGEWWETDKFEDIVLDGSRPITKWNSSLIKAVVSRHQSQNIGVIGMCLTGAMPLSLLDHQEIKAVVLAQPTLPLISGEADDLGISENEWEIAKQRAKAENIHVYGVRYQNDKIAKRDKHCRLKAELGEKVFLDREIKVEEYCEKDQNGDFNICPSEHSSLTYGWYKEREYNDPMNVRRREVQDFLRNWLVPSGMDQPMPLSSHEPCCENRN